MKTLQTVTAVIEAGAGAALLGLPSATASLLFGTPLELAVETSLARVGGAALLALGIACWSARRDADGLVSRGLVVAMLFYNLAVVAVLAWADLRLGLHGVLLWPAVTLHATMGIWCVIALKRGG